MSSTADQAEQPTDDVNDPNPSTFVPDRDNPLASAFAHATRRSTQPGSTKSTGGGGSLGDLAREVSGTRSKTDKESGGDQQEA